MTAPRSVYVRRTELVVVGDEPHALQQNMHRPDFKGGPARVIGQCRQDLLEHVDVRIGLLPLGPTARRRHRKHVAGRHTTLEGLRNNPAGGGGVGLEGFWTTLWHGGGNAKPARSNPARGRPSGGGDPGLQLEERLEKSARARRLAQTHALFELQILIKASSTVEGHAVDLANQMVAAFAVLTDGSALRPAGRRFGFRDTTWWFRGADASKWSRWWFDLRHATGLHWAHRRSVVASAEAVPFYVPPTQHAEGPVHRSGGAVPAAPLDLPEYRGQRDVLPFAAIPDGNGGERHVGLHMDDTLFGQIAGGSGSGKSEVGSQLALHIGDRTPYGLFFLDPHRQAFDRLQDYLPGQADRLVLFDISPMAEKVIGWNWLDMTGRGEEDIEARIDPLMDALILVNGWNRTTGRAITLTRHTLRSLATIGWRLRDQPEVQPTIFQFLTLLHKPEWRDAVTPHLLQEEREYWQRQFNPNPTFAADAVGPVTHTIGRMRTSQSLRTMLGQSHGHYDIRRFMDQGKLVLASTHHSSKEVSKLVTAMLVFDLFAAAKSRADTPEGKRRLMLALMDEAQLYDDGTLAEVLREVRKFKLAAFVLNQEPSALTDATRNALATNGSHLIVGRLGAADAKDTAEAFGRNGNTPIVAPTTLTRLETYLPARDDREEQRPQYVTSVTVNGTRTGPFKVRGVAVRDTWAHLHHPERRGDLERIVDRNTARKTPAEVRDALADLDQRILDALAALRPARSGGRATIDGNGATDPIDDGLTY